jgi:hypothetical protein
MILHVQGGVIPDQEFDSFRAEIVYCLHQWSLALCILGVNVGALIYQQLHSLHAVSTRRKHQDRLTFVGAVVRLCSPGKKNPGHVGISARRRPEQRRLAESPFMVRIGAEGKQSADHVVTSVSCCANERRQQHARVTDPYLHPLRMVDELGVKVRALGHKFLDLLEIPLFNGGEKGAIESARPPLASPGLPLTYQGQSERCC